MKKILIFICSVFVFVGILSTADLLAFNNEFSSKDVRVENTETTISISWGNIADIYLISLDGKKFSETKKNKISIDNLESGNPYEIKITGLKNGEVIDNVVVQTNTLKSSEQNKKKKHKIEVASTTAIFTDHEAKIIFSGVPDDDLVYDVYRNKEVKVGTLNGKSDYIYDENLKPETDYRYSVVGEEKFSKTEVEKLKKTIVLPKNSEEGLVNTFEVARSIKTISKEHVVSAASYEHWYNPSDGVEFIYTTFIPMKKFEFDIEKHFRYLGAVKPRVDYYKFHGDGRGYDIYGLSDAFRTRTYTRVQFPKSGGSTIKFIHDSNKTQGQNRHTGNWRAREADMDEVYITNKVQGDTKATFYVKHNAINSLHNAKDVTGKTWAAPGISYEFSGEVHKAGYFKLSGLHDAAPNHEMSWTRIPGEVHRMWIDGRWVYSDSTMRVGFGHWIGHLGFYGLFPGTPRMSISEEGYWK